MVEREMTEATPTLTDHRLTGLWLPAGVFALILIINVIWGGFSVATTLEVVGVAIVYAGVVSLLGVAMWKRQQRRLQKDVSA